jgi:hypothetical protein
MVRGQERALLTRPFADVAPPVDSGHLTRHILRKAERGNPVHLPLKLRGKANREGSRRVCGFEMLEEANAGL